MLQHPVDRLFAVLSREGRVGPLERFDQGFGVRLALPLERLCAGPQGEGALDGRAGER